MARWCRTSQCYHPVEGAAASSLLESACVQRDDAFMNTRDVMNAKWCGLDWTSWLPFEAERKAFQQFERVAGVYRVRVRGTGVLAYIGQTGRSLRERL